MTEKEEMEEKKELAMELKEIWFPGKSSPAGKEDGGKKNKKREGER